MLPANTAKSIMKTKGFLALAAAAILIPLLLFGCSGNDGNTVRIATKPQTEQFLLGEMLKLVIEQDTGLAVAITHGVGGGTANIHPALLKGEFDLYPEYTGTAWLYVLKNKPDPDEQNMRRALFAEYPEKFGLEWVGLYGFNNSFGLAVRKDIADKHGLKSYSDLVPISGDLTFGAEYDFYEREDGYDALVRTYGFKFPKHIDLDIGLKYPAIGKGEIDVMNVFTTDGQLNAGTVTVLRDDKNFYQTYYCGTVARRETLDKHPNLEPALRKMEGVLDDEEMSRLNYEVDVKGRQPTDVAREFLVGKGLLRAGQ